ncbi:MAG: CBS domain-containing protein [Desulfamplus sp.]|nr:CBS domain-containing protein [Desulfamplus sp.]
MKSNTLNQCTIGFSEDDIIEAMRDISGYLDITPSDFKEIYQIASRHALERLKNSVKAEHVMTTPVITVEEKTSILDAAKLMAENNISGIPVLDSKQYVCGVISEKDFLKKIIRKDGKINSSFMSLIAQCLEVSGCLTSDIRLLSVNDIMSSPPVTVQKSISIMDVSAIFELHKINRVPVLDSNSKLIGIIARSDLVHALC